MVQTSVQYTPVQVLQAARRAEAEGKMDYALQFYRHLVEHHGATPEAQEAREGLFRIAEWRWGEARVARRQEAAGAQGGASQASPPAPPSPPATPQYGSEAAETSAAASSAPQLPQVIARQSLADDLLPPFKGRYRAARVLAFILSGLGFAGVLAGIAIAALAMAGTVAEISAPSSFDLPVGVLLGIPAVLIGLVLVVGGQLAAAIFESANATLELLAIERARSSF